jgi:hypothetical protein
MIGRRLGVDQREVLRGDVVQLRPQQEDRVGLRQAASQRGVHPDAQIARVVRMVVVDEILPPEGDGQRCAQPRGKLPCARAVIGAPQRTAQQDHGAFGGGEEARGLGDGGVVDPGTGRGGDDRARRLGLGGQDVLRQGEHDRPGPSTHREAEGAVDVFGHTVGAFHLGHPFHQRAEKRAVIDLLEHAAVAMAQGHLPHEDDHRRRVMHRDVQAGTGIRRPWSARDEQHPGPPCQLRVRLRHHRRAAFLAADDVLDVVVIEPVERGEEAFAGNREHPVDPVQGQPVGQDFSAVFLGQDRLPP